MSDERMNKFPALVNLLEGEGIHIAGVILLTDLGPALEHEAHCPVGSHGPPGRLRGPVGGAADDVEKHGAVQLLPILLLLLPLSGQGEGEGGVTVDA